MREDDKITVAFLTLELSLISLHLLAEDYTYLVAWSMVFATHLYLIATGAIDG